MAGTDGYIWTRSAIGSHGIIWIFTRGRAYCNQESRCSSERSPGHAGVWLRHRYTINKLQGEENFFFRQAPQNCLLAIVNQGDEWIRCWRSILKTSALHKFGEKASSSAKINQLKRFSFQYWKGRFCKMIVLFRYSSQDFKLSTKRKPWRQTWHFSLARKTHHVV